ncbi:MAG TPA: ABC transporter substrate-binding protein [Ramlibacter sp.]|nr:ABC transporter substrate-binding protein [Ramlibacter sp.]
MNRAFLPLALATALALPATAALAQGRTGVVRIGINDSLSGALVGFGTPPVAAIRLAISEINQKGFVVGDTTYRLQAVEVDNRSEGAATIAGMTRLVEDDKVRIIFGPTASALANQAQEITVPNKVLHISAAGSWQTLGYLSDPKKPLLFGTQQPLSAIARSEVDAIKKLGARKFAYISADDDTTKGNMPALLNEAKAQGLAVTTLLFPPKTTDFSSFVNRAKADGAEATYFLWPQGTAPDVMRAVSEQNAGAKGFVARNVSPQAALKLAIGKPLGFPFYSVQGTPSYDYPPNPKVKAYADRLKAAAGDLGVAANFSFFTYDFVGMLVAAMQKAGTVEDTAKIAQAMAGLTYEGVAGKVCFDQQVRTAMYDGGQILVKDGKVESSVVPSGCK